jgi:hypothetical protein
MLVVVAVMRGVVVTLRGLVLHDVLTFYGATTDQE